MYTEIIFEKDGERQRWLGSLDNLKRAHPKASIKKVSNINSEIPACAGMTKNEL